ncbi:BamA/TamA family outer membrane protein [Thaumasiovibrio subtropicus]|uniref:BamA/TamA family outer membrane protein n=1 Tax=Thaumasiovibrio subtropicus TaxID=1891207 RepID=UPI00131B007C|nr:BamA/TamA family outer membrane protein [Thaumasiovibrio subtropicus]
MYKLIYLFLAGVFLSAGMAEGKETDDTIKEDKTFALAPMVSSSPSMGTGLGFNASYLYQTDEQSRPSQLMMGGQYTTNDSYNLWVMNNASLKSDTIRSISFVGNWHVNNSFKQSCPNDANDCDPNEEVKYNSDNIVIGQRLMFDIGHNFWFGGGGYWGRNIAKGLNAAGDDFVDARNMSSTNTAGLFLAVSYDTRDNNFYPMQGSMIELSPSMSIKALGSEYNAKQLRVDARHYMTVNQNDVIALQSVANVVEKGTPVSGQSFLGRNNVLRGFNAGEYMGEALYAAQAEYRYHISDKWKLVGFGGLGALRGETARQFDNDNLYYSAGAGVRYAIQPQARVHFRFDIAIGNDGNDGFYVGIQEAF